MTRSTLLVRVAAAVAPAALLLAGPAMAQTAPAADAAPAPDATTVATPTAGDGSFDFSKDTITVGVGAAYVPDYDGSKHYRLLPAPVALGSYKGVSFALAGNWASANFFPQTPGKGWNIEAGPVGLVNFNRTSNKNISDARVKLLPQRETALELGGYIGLSRTGLITSDYDKLTFSTSVRWDVTGKSNGYVVTPSLTYLTPLSRKAAVGLLASGAYVGTRYARYYYGVTRADSIVSGLPVFNATQGWNSFTVGGFATYSLTGDLLHGFKVVAGGTYSRNQGPSARSPLVTVAGSRNQFIGGAGLAYTF